MIRRIVVATLTAVAATLALAVFYPAPLDAQPSGWEYACELRLDFENRRRRIPGDVNTECIRIHSPPWGNWGVESPYSRRYDGYQFPGWMQTGEDPNDSRNWYQWNSCTKNFLSQYWYNDGAGRQKAAPDDTRWYAGTNRPIAVRRGQTCRNVAHGMVYTERNFYMELYELDKRDDDEKVTRLSSPPGGAGPAYG